LDRRWLTNDGPYVREFESAIADLHQVRHCIAMASGTVALEVAVRACGISGEAILPSFTFIATAHCLAWLGIAPVFCDIERQGHHIAPNCIDSLVTSETTGMIAVHTWGRPANVEALEAIARRRGLRLIFDAAHAFMCSDHGRMIGGSGSCEILSFHATKVLNTLEGGAVLTNDDALAEQLRLMRNFGFRTYDDVGLVGTNGKMNEVAAAMGLTLLESMPEILDRNRRVYEAYQNSLAGVAGVEMLPFESGERRNLQYVVVLIDEAEAGLARDDLQAVLHAENILARRYFYPGCHRMDPYSHPGWDLPVTDDVAARVLVLPAGAAMSESDAECVASIIEKATASAPHLRGFLAQRSVV
jgi:dTDP-4-amino-4,6-dideoxygalactose transaminase